VIQRRSLLLAGQLVRVEGYVESAATRLPAGPRGKTLVFADRALRDRAAWCDAHGPAAAGGSASIA
jgi:folate-dependent tRNA-U54 methylase TrmFO/GidA